MYERERERDGSVRRVEVFVALCVLCVFVTVCVVCDTDD